MKELLVFMEILDIRIFLKLEEILKIIYFELVGKLKFRNLCFFLLFYDYKVNFYIVFYFNFDINKKLVV